MLRFTPGGVLTVLALLGVAVAGLVAPPPVQTWKVIGWSDTGMHAIDPDYSVFSFHPPANNLRAQVISPAGLLLTTLSGMTLTYEAVADATGSQNRTSAGKTNFWSFAQDLYGSAPAADVGLSGSAMPGPGNVPRSMSFDPTTNVFKADGIPVTPHDDAFHFRPYPLMKLVLRNAAGTAVANTKVVTPVSDEFNCRVCHGSGVGIAQPSSGWSNDPDSDRDYRHNILKIHDELNAGRPEYAAALATCGYAPTGLEDTAKHGTPVRCSRCHASNELPGSGIAGIEPLTRAMHGLHTFVPDPQAGGLLEFNNTRVTCYRCHPGEQTQALRGTMGNYVDASGNRAIQCQSCHGSMSKVADPNRQGWLDEPVCQSCHTGTAINNNGEIRYTSALKPDGSPRIAVDLTFATTPDVPTAGHSLFSASTGHGGLACAACHGPAHAETATSQANDNVQATAIQSHSGKLVECRSCHDQDPITIDGGPHGMHPVGQQWVDDHHDAPQSAFPNCRKCHGADYRGTILSQTNKARTLHADWGNITFAAGAQVGCYSCHQGPTNDNQNPNHKPVAQNATATSIYGQPATITLTATDQDANPLTYRIVGKPAHGRVGLAGNVATYYPDPGFAGPDPFTFVAWDGSTDSNLGTVTVTRGAESATYGDGLAGSFYVPPGIYLLGVPSLGTSVDIYIENSAGIPTTAFLIFSTEQISVPIGYGGRLLTEPQIFFAVPMPPEGLTINWNIPNDPALTGLSIFGQVIEVDPGTLFGFSASRGLRATIGI